MQKSKAQSDFLKISKKIFEENRYNKFGRRHWSFLLGFLRLHRFYFLLAVFFVVFQICSETFLLFFSKNFSPSGYKLFYFLLLVVVFLFSSFFSIKLEKTLVIELVNNLRKRLLTGFFENLPNHQHFERQAGLMAKLSFQLSLVSVGFTSSFFGLLKLFFYWLGLIILVTFVLKSFLIPIICLFFLGVAISLIAFLISKFYVSLDNTFYSGILKEADEGASEAEFIKKFKQEKNLLTSISELVSLDNYARIRRELWLKFSGSVLFVFLATSSLMLNYYLVFPGLKSLAFSESSVFYFLFFIFISRTLYLHLRVGLFWIPLKLGLCLCLPKDFIKRDNRSFHINQGIVFKSKKIKFFKEDFYRKNINFNFHPGEKIIFYGQQKSGKTSLAKIFAGTYNYYPSAWRVVIDGERLPYRSWASGRNVYFVDPNFRSQKTVLELVSGTDKRFLSAESLEKVWQIIEGLPNCSKKKISRADFSGENLLTDPVTNFTLQIASCVFLKPEIIVVDNLWLDLKYKEIQELLNFLTSNLPKTILILMSREKNNYYQYDQVKSLDKK